MSEVVVFEKFDRFLKSSSDTRLGIRATYCFKNKYRATVEHSIWVTGCEDGIWRVELLGRPGQPNKVKRSEENAWLNKFFSIECTESSECFVWHLNEKDAETILEEIMKIKVSFWNKVRSFFR